MLEDTNSLDGAHKRNYLHWNPYFLRCNENSNTCNTMQGLNELSKLSFCTYCTAMLDVIIILNI